jgi:hypothetical protein
VLPCEKFRWRQHRALKPCTGGGSGRHECNRRLPRTNITLQEAQHWLASGEVRQDGINRR